MTDLELELLPSRLCFVEENKWAWFTTQSVSDATGPEWDIAPYERNAGPPYPWMPNSNVVPYSLTIIGFRAELYDPAFFAPSIKISVKEINNQISPWLRSGPWERQEIEIWAGATITEFLDALRAMGGKAFMEI